MRGAFVVVVALAGCGFQHGIAATTTDVDAPSGSACATWQVRHFDACLIPMPSTGVHVQAPASPLTYDTTNGGGTLTDATGATIAITSIDYTQTDGVHAALWTMNDLTIDSGVELDVIGTKPLIVAAWGTISIAGTVDAGSHTGVRDGAGANPDACATHAAGNGADGASGTGGGGGGGYGGNGATGGVADSNCAPTPPACELAGGRAGGFVVAPATVLGGCDGGTSGLSSSAFAAGGRGGGAVLFAARTSIAVTGTLLAGGGGGPGDATASYSLGGGGGGAGGFLGLESVSVDVSGSTLAANGGGGGAGADIAGSGSGGGDGAAGIVGSLGGVSGSGGTDGGTGSSQSSLDGGAVSTNVQVGGGGGGGGGAGLILYWAPSFTMTGATVSPPAMAP